MKKLIRKAITRKRTIREEVKSALYLLVCDNCGKVFDMQQCYNSSLKPASLQGIFDIAPYGQGNMFLATVCSFQCAHNLFTGGWKKIKEYKNYARHKAELVWVELRLTNTYKDETTAIKEWESK